jgi:DNA-directed RNA polymerase subunit RPC12/RpoP
MNKAELNLLCRIEALETKFKTWKEQREIKQCPNCGHKTPMAKILTAGGSNSFTISLLTFDKVPIYPEFICLVCGKTFKEGTQLTEVKV